MAAAEAVNPVLRYLDRISTVIGKNGVPAGSVLIVIILAATAANMIHGELFALGIAELQARFLERTAIGIGFSVSGTHRRSHPPMVG